MFNEQDWDHYRVKEEREMYTSLNIGEMVVWMLETREKKGKKMYFFSPP